MVQCSLAMAGLVVVVDHLDALGMLGRLQAHHRLEVDHVACRLPAAAAQCSVSPVIERDKFELQPPLDPRHDA